MFKNNKEKLQSEITYRMTPLFYNVKHFKLVKEHIIEPESLAHLFIKTVS